MTTGNLTDLALRYPELEPCLPDIRAAFRLLRDCFHRGGKLLVCGNGGSASDSEHIVGELMKGFLCRRPLPQAERSRLEEAVPQNAAYLAGHLQGALPAISLASQSALLTAFANDVAADMAFAQQVYGYGRAGDVLLGISTSGCSPNVLHALQVARAMGLRTLGLAGGSGGAMLEWCDVIVRAPGADTAEIQGLHQAIYHALCAMLEAEFFSQD